MKNWQPYLIGALGGAILVVLALLGTHTFSSLAAVPAGAPAEADFAPLWDAWRTIDQNFQPAASTTPVTNQERVWGAVSGLVNSLGDPYSVFMSPTENKTFNQEIEGQFGGIGIEIGVRDQALTVISALPDSPARAAGLKSGDKIIEVAEQPVGELSLYQAINLIRGEVGTTVKLTVIRAGTDKPLQFNLKRSVIQVPTLDTKQSGDTFIISLYNFGATSPDLFRNALRQFVASGQSKLVIDLRGNPGGFLEAAVDIGSWFLPAGKPIVIEKRDDAGQTSQQVYRSKGYDIFNDQLKLIVLVDGGSASAAEILAGALADNHRATLVGETTFGKGSVQELLPLTGGGALKLTIAHWLTPNGISISKAGLKPDVEVKLTAADVAAGRDPQLAKALAL